MAQLTLKERGAMASDSTFQQRLTSAIKKTAQYWMQYTLFPNNVAVWKRKQFASQILFDNRLDILAYGQSLLSIYNVDPPVMDGTQLADSELTDSAASAATYDLFSNIIPSDL